MFKPHRGFISARPRPWIGVHVKISPSAESAPSIYVRTRWTFREYSGPRQYFATHGQVHLLAVYVPSVTAESFQNPSDNHQGSASVNFSPRIKYSKLCLCYLGSRIHATLISI